MIEGLIPYCPKPTAKIIKVGKPKGKECCIHRVIYIHLDKNGNEIPKEA